MENIRNRVVVRLVSEQKKAGKLAAKPSFKHLTIFDENLIAIHMKRTKLVFNKPVYCGMAILDISKTLMYMIFTMIIFFPNMERKRAGQSSSSLIRILCAMKLKQKIFSRIFQMMLKQNLTQVILKKIIHHKSQLEKTKKFLD